MSYRRVKELKHDILVNFASVGPHWARFPNGSECRLGTNREIDILPTWSKQVKSSWNFANKLRRDRRCVNQRFEFPTTIVGWDIGVSKQENNVFRLLTFCVYETWASVTSDREDVLKYQTSVRHSHTWHDRVSLLRSNTIWSETVWMIVVLEGKGTPPFPLT